MTMMMEQQDPSAAAALMNAKAEDIHEAAGAPESGAPAAEAEATPDLKELKLALEAALLAATEPLQPADLKKLFEGRISADTVRILLEEIRADWVEKSIELTMVANGWRFRVKPEYQKYIDRLNPEKPPRYSRAVMETLAIIAYRQPVTRGNIEDIRGVLVSPGILKALEERGWIDVVGHKDVPGRPALFATTKKFLDDLNLRSLEELPPLHELQATLDMSALQAPLPAAPGLLDEADAATAAEAPAEPGFASFTDDEPEVPDSTLPVVAP